VNMTDGAHHTNGEIHSKPYPSMQEIAFYLPVFEVGAVTWLDRVSFAALCCGCNRVFGTPIFSSTVALHHSNP
jgi:hypothetical protein